MDPNWLVPATLFVCCAIAFGLGSFAILSERREEQKRAQGKA